MIYIIIQTFLIINIYFKSLHIAKLSHFFSNKKKPWPISLYMYILVQYSYLYEIYTTMIPLWSCIYSIVIIFSYKLKVTSYHHGDITFSVAWTRIWPQFLEVGINLSSVPVKLFKEVYKMVFTVYCHHSCYRD